VAESIGAAGAAGGRRAFADMSKSGPTRFNIPHNNGTCKRFLRFFLDGPGEERKMLEERRF